MMTFNASSAAAFARQQPVASCARLETKSDTPDGSAIQLQPLDGLAATLVAVAPAGRAQALADAITQCLDGNTLRLTRLDAEWKPTVCQWPAEAWTRLDGLAGEGGIVRVDLPCADECEEVATLAARLALLPSLEVLHLAVPRFGSDIDLSALHALQRPLSLQLYCLRAGPWRVTVPQDTQLRALGEGTRRHHPLKPTVSYVDRHGQPTGKAHALPGIPYLAKPPASIVDACQGDTKAARQVALGLNTNGRAQFDGKGASSTDDLEARTIWCRHIAWQVGAEWRERRALQRAGERVTMSYEPYATPKALKAHVKPETQARYQRDLAREAVALFTDYGFGQALEAQFDGLPPGQERIFLLVTFNHAMTLEVRRKGGHCIVTCYDPNVSTVPIKLLVTDASQLSRLTLGDLLGSRHRDYVKHGQFVAGALYACGPDSARDSALCRLYDFTGEVIGSGEGLYWLMHCGATGDIDRSVQGIVASQRPTDTAFLMDQLSACHQGFSGLMDALAHKQHGTVDAYVQAIRRHALPILGEAGVAQLLKDIPPPEDPPPGGKDATGAAK